MTQIVTVIIRHILPTLTLSSSSSVKASSISLFAWSGSAVKSFQASRTSLPTDLSELFGDLSLLPLSLALLFASSDSLLEPLLISSLGVSELSISTLLTRLTEMNLIFLHIFDVSKYFFACKYFYRIYSSSAASSNVRVCGVWGDVSAD